MFIVVLLQIDDLDLQMELFSPRNHIERSLGLPIPKYNSGIGIFGHYSISNNPAALSIFLPVCRKETTRYSMI
jgi:hypothetical protein